VVDVNYLGVGSATLWVNDSLGIPNPNAPFTTDIDGWVKWIVVTEYIEDANNGKSYHTPHNASAREGLRFGNIMVTMSLSKNVVVVLDGINFHMSLEKGWNMISVPMNHSNTSLLKILESIDGKYNAVQWYNISDVFDPWKHYVVDKASTLLDNCNDLNTITNEMGIWIYMPQNEILSMTGRVPQPTATGLLLKKGPNLVGYPSLTSRIAGTGFGEAFESIFGYVDLVEYYNASDISDPWKMWDPTPAPDDLVVVEPGFGLWIHVNGDCIWNVDW
jgi:hypothetical protein